MNKKLHVVVRKRDQLLYQGEAMAVSSTNRIGDFDILPEHTNFVSTIEKLLTVHLDKTIKKDYEIQNGIIRVYNDNVEVFIGI